MINDRKQKLDELFEAFSIISDGAYVFLCDMTCDLSRWSEKAVEFFGLPDKYMRSAGEIWEKRIHPEDRHIYHTSIEAIFSGNASGHEMQYRAAARDGNYVVCTCRGLVIRDSDGNPEYFGGAIRNHGMLSYIDNLTGMRSLYGYLDDIRTSIGKGEKCLHLLIGISSFSDVNDVFGYTIGNKVLHRFALCIHDIFSSCGSVYRLDGTKFAVISHITNVSRMMILYEKLRSMVRDLEIEDEHITLSLNCGALVADKADICVDTFYSCLKYAYYLSKKRKLGDMVMYEDQLTSDNRDTIERINAIRNSIQDNCTGFSLHYQPIVDAGTEQIKGLEALIRWSSDEYGSVPPNEFIPVLEQDSLFPELGEWILRQAMNDTRRLLRKYPDLVVNVNISYTQISKTDFAASVLRILDETGYPAANLCLEITERCRLLDMELLKSVIGVLKARGIRIALDDFGTGFSSLGVLREIGVDTVKIDKSFVSSLDKDFVDRNTVRFITELAQSFLAEVCAEGVENTASRDYLRTCNVTSLQGYLYSKPVPADKLYSVIL